MKSEIPVPELPPIALLPGVRGYGDVSVVIVDTRNTSRTCPSCGMVDKKNRPARYEFLCVSCSLAAPADRIATKSISARV
jgi:transposase